MKWLKSIYLRNELFYVLILLSALYTLSFFFKSLFPFITVGSLILGTLVILDFIVLFGTKPQLSTERIYPERLSNGDLNKLAIKVSNLHRWKVRLRIIEELPIQFQTRDFQHHVTLKPKETNTLRYTVKPNVRGQYEFGHLNIFMAWLGIFERRVIDQQPMMIKTYPSYLKLQHYTLMATTNHLQQMGLKKIRRVGTTAEFDNIRTYSSGDEYRFINWKATGKAHKLMVNQYREERSQPVYNIIDLGRAMRMPFEGMTLVDYAINASLVFANVTLAKQEKAGLLTFNQRVEKHIIADRKNHQMQMIVEALYAVKTDFKETDFGRLYSYTKKHLTQRALLMVYTNFETIDALERQIQYLKLIKKNHVLVVILFKNTELEKFIHETPQDSMAIYRQTIAEKLMYDKELIIHRLHQLGIHTIYTAPNQLTINSINKYMELKARGLF